LDEEEVPAGAVRVDLHLFVVVVTEAAGGRRMRGKAHDERE
jgi:hypothetical protein